MLSISKTIKTVSGPVLYSVAIVAISLFWFLFNCTLPDFNAVKYALLNTGHITLPALVLALGVAYLLLKKTTLAAKAVPLLPYFKKILLIALLSAVLIGILVTALRLKEDRLFLQGYSPGAFFPYMNFYADSLYTESKFMADESGMTSINPALHTITNDGEVNRQGFYANFDYTPAVADSLRRAGKKIVFVIGDSFVAGTTSTTFNNTFVEILRNNNPDWAVFNLGVRGVDPVNYRLVAEKFIVPLRPDKVLLAFCSHNDIMLYNRTPVPNVPLLYSCPQGNFMTAVPPECSGKVDMNLPPAEAYRFYRERYSIFTRPDRLAKLFSKKCVTTLLFYKPTDVDYADKLIHLHDSAATFKNLYAIKQLCDSVQAPFSIAFIPTPENCHYTKADYQHHYGWVFKNLMEYTSFMEPENAITPSNFLPNDIHFNDSGNLKFAKFLQRIAGHTATGSH